MKPPRIALFGGTFDPVHEGHLAMASRARRDLRLDQVIFLPCHTSPHKLHHSSAPGAHRLAMTRLACADLPWAEVDDFDLTSPPPSYSYRTALAMTARRPDAEWFWLMGLDQWDALPRWAEPATLARLLHFIVVSRHGTPAPREGYRMTPIGDFHHPASSTAIRQAFASGSAEPPWLPPAVAAYIRLHHLYSPTPDT